MRERVERGGRFFTEKESIRFLSIERKSKKSLYMPLLQK
jgi:hypothetical protein